MRFLTKPPEEATPRQRIAGVVILTLFLLACAVKW